MPLFCPIGRITRHFGSQSLLIRWCLVTSCLQLRVLLHFCSHRDCGGSTTCLSSFLTIGFKYHGLWFRFFYCILVFICRSWLRNFFFIVLLLESFIGVYKHGRCSAFDHNFRFFYLLILTIFSKWLFLIFGLFNIILDTLRRSGLGSLLLFSIPFLLVFAQFATVLHIAVKSLISLFLTLYLI